MKKWEGKGPDKQVVLEGGGGGGGGGGQEFENFGIFFSLPEKKFKFGLSGWFFGNSKIPYTFPNHTGPSDAKIQPQ